jgi:hypothetical protein
MFSWSFHPPHAVEWPVSSPQYVHLVSPLNIFHLPEVCTAIPHSSFSWPPILFLILKSGERFRPLRTVQNSNKYFPRYDECRDDYCACVIFPHWNGAFGPTGTEMEKRSGSCTKNNSDDHRERDTVG